MKQSNKKKFLSSIKEIARKHLISDEKISELLTESIKNNFLKEFDDNSISISINLKSGTIKMWRNLKIVNDKFFFGKGFEDEETLITLTEAKKINTKSSLKVGATMKKEVFFQDFDLRLIKNIFLNFQQLILEQENQKIYEQWNQYKGIVVEGVVEKVIEGKDLNAKEIFVSISFDNKTYTKGVILRYDLIQTDFINGCKVYENLILGNTYYFYIKEVFENATSCPIALSRTHPEIVKYLMSKNISEISDGFIEIKMIARIAGIKTKVLVSSNKKNLDPVGCCIGPKGKRLKVILNQLLNEKIDVILWSDNEIKNVINSFVPGKILGYKVNGEKEITLISTLDQVLSAIGKKGINAKLVYMLTGWRVDLKTIQEAKDEKIEYVHVDEVKNKGSSNISNRIYEMHYMKNDEFLNKINDLVEEESEEDKWSKNKTQDEDRTNEQ